MTGNYIPWLLLRASLSFQCLLVIVQNFFGSVLFLFYSTLPNGRGKKTFIFKINLCWNIVYLSYQLSFIIFEYFNPFACVSCDSFRSLCILFSALISILGNKLQILCILIINYPPLFQALSKLTWYMSRPVNHWGVFENTRISLVLNII